MGGGGVSTPTDKIEHLQFTPDEIRTMIIYLPPESVAKTKVVLQAGLQSLEISVDAGVTICYGTDLLGPLTVARSREVALRSQVMSSFALLQTVTVNAAKLLRQEISLGQIQPDFKADILILEKNPLEDISIFDDSSEVLVGIMKDVYLYKSRLEGVQEEFSIVSEVLKPSL